MLVRFEDIKGKTYWVNPTHVKILQEGRKGLSEIMLAYSGSGLGNLVIKVDRPIDEVAAILNAGMPDIELAPPAAYDEHQGGDDLGTSIAAGLIG